MLMIEVRQFLRVRILEAYRRVQVFTLERPFSSLKGDPAIIIAILEGKRPERPEKMAGRIALESIWDLTQRCWHQEAHERPAMSAVRSRLEECLSIESSAVSPAERPPTPLPHDVAVVASSVRPPAPLAHEHTAPHQHQQAHRGGRALAPFKPMDWQTHFGGGGGGAQPAPRRMRAGSIEGITYPDEWVVPDAGTARSWLNPQTQGPPSPGSRLVTRSHSVPSDEETSERDDAGGCREKCTKCCIIC